MVWPKDPIRRTILDELFPNAPSKAQARQFQIMEVAIEQFARRGIESVRYAELARECGISRALIQHYFPQVEDLALTAIRYVRGRFQAYCVDAIRAERTPAAQLKAYLDATYGWLEDFPSHAKVWLLFYYYCGIKRKHRSLNTELVAQGQARIEALLESGVRSGEFRAVDDRSLRAKQIQNTLTGGLLSAITEDDSASQRKIRRATVALCMELAGRNVKI